MWFERIFKSAQQVSCPKCGSLRSSYEYHLGISCSHDHVQHEHFINTSSEATTEWMHRECDNCQYMWDEKIEAPKVSSDI